MRYLVVSALVLLSTACANQTKLAKESVEASVLHDNPVTYRQLKNYPGKVVCGQFNIKRRVKDKNFNPFIYRPSSLDTRPSEDDIAIFCSPDSVSSLYDATGIRYTKESAVTLSRISEDFAVLTTALEQYELDNFMLPRTTQGLEALIHASEIAPRPRRFREGAYLKQLPLDPWGRPYHYDASQLAGGVKGSFIISTLGADGKEGGTGDNADINSNQMKYLRHIEQL